MRIYKRGPTWWAQWNGRRFSLGVSDRKAAELAFAELQRRAASPAHARASDAARATIATACGDFLDAAPTLGNRAKPLAAGTLEMLAYHVGHFRRILGDATPLETVDAETVDKYIRRRRSEAIPRTNPVRYVSAKTVANEIGTLRQVLRHAARAGKYARSLDAVLPARLSPEYKPLERALSEAQIPALLAALPAKRAAAAAFVVGLGADRCAIARARIADFDLTSDPPTVLVRGTKNARRWARVPVLGPFAGYVAMAAGWLTEHGSFGEWRNAPRDLAAACQAAGVPRVTLRDLRRSFGRILRAQGVPPSLLAELLRHADGRMAERVYGRLTPADVGNLAAAAIGTPMVHYTEEKTT